MAALPANVLVFLASACVLVIEILAGRLLAPYIGVSIETFTGIIGTVLAGIAAGNALGGFLADHQDPRRLLGPFLVLGGILTWCVLPIVGWLGPEAGEGPAAIVLLAAAAFFLPALALSTVTPMAAKLRLHDVGRTGSVVGGLSAASTAGALAGTFVTGFVLVAALASGPIVVVVGAVLVALGIVCTIGLRAQPTAMGVALAVVAAAGVLALTARAPTPCERETAYFCATVEADPARPSGRTLVLDRLRHAYVDLDDPTHLEFRYIELFARVAAAMAPQEDVVAVHIGGGGFSFPRYLAATRAGSTHRVLEIDDEIVSIAEARLGLERSERLRVEIGDARLALQRIGTGTVDLVVGDAFASLSVPWQLTTAEAVRDIERVLRPGGVYMMNVIDGSEGRFSRAAAATLAEVFGHVAVILPVGGVKPGLQSNHVLIATDHGIPDIDTGSLGELLRGQPARDWIADARLLTDDHAPVDQLVERP